MEEIVTLVCTRVLTDSRERNERNRGYGPQSPPRAIGWYPNKKHLVKKEKKLLSGHGVVNGVPEGHFSSTRKKEIRG
jgi:hypothetical protein